MFWLCSLPYLVSSTAAAPIIHRISTALSTSAGEPLTLACHSRTGTRPDAHRWISMCLCICCPGMGRDCNGRHPGFQAARSVGWKTGTSSGAFRSPFQQKYCPPLAVMVDPVMKPASSEARKTTQRPISAASPNRPVGICAMMDSRTFSGTAMTMSVAI